MMALVIAAVMVLALAAPAMAADGRTISISVKSQEQADQKNKSETYYAYKVFDVTTSVTSTPGNYSDDTLGEGKDSGYSYTISTSSEWYNIVKEKLSEYITLTDTTNLMIKSVSLESGVKNSEATAKAIAKILKENIGSIEPSKTLSSDGSNGPLSVTDAAAGYYLITSSLGTNLIAGTTDIIITEKNDYPSLEKTVATASNFVGDKVEYTIEVKVPESADTTKYMYVTDTLDEHLKYDSSSLNAKIKDTETTVTLMDLDSTDDSAYVKIGVTFQKKFQITEAMLGKSVILTYKAEVLSTSETDKPYYNKAFLDYSEYETPESKVKVYTHDFDLDKNFQNVTGDDAANYSATFELKDSNGNTISFITDSKGYVKADSDDTGASATLTVNGKDNINVRGLAAGEYTLTEKTTADGYNLMSDTVRITITDTTGTSENPSHTVKYQIGSGSESTGTVTIENKTGSLLPSTGGVGTTLFYVIGAILVIGAGVLLVTRRRMNAD